MRLQVFVIIVGLLISVDAFGSNYWKLKSLLKKNSLEKHAAKYSSHNMPNSPQLPIARVIIQPLDHFDPQVKETYAQRYWVNSKYWDHKDGPVFLYVGGEGSLDESSTAFGAYVKFAEKYKALIFAVEHRFYGQSLNDDGLETRNLKYLSSQQALADLANFHLHMSKANNLTEKNKWISFGGSYPGALSAWVRIKYPHLIHGAVASSAPVRAVANFEGYNDVVAKSLSTALVGGSEKCADKVRQAFRTVDDLLKKGNLTKLSADFLSCKPIQTDDDIFQFASNLADVFMGTVQYNDELPGSLDIKSVCEIMTQDADDYQNLMTLNQKFLQMTQQTCSDNSWDSFVRQLSNVTLDRGNSGGVGMRQWTYQTCAQFGYYQTCDDDDCLFSRSMTLSPNFVLCKMLFNLNPDDVYNSIDFTNSYYGSDQPRGSRILFVNGLIDPWHALSVLDNVSPTELALIIPGTAHCADMRDDSPSDPPALTAARQKINDQIGEWLVEPEDAPHAPKRRHFQRRGLSAFQLL